MEVAGSNPAPSTNFGKIDLKQVSLLPKNYYHLLPEYKQFLKVNLRLEDTTIRESVGNITRFLMQSKGNTDYNSVRQYLSGYLSKKPKTYNSQITDLRRFVRDFLGNKELLSTFKMAPVDEFGRLIDTPTKKQLRKGFEALEDDCSRSIYLFTATSGLRKCEILAVQKQHVNLKTKCVIPKHFTRKKRSGITFYSEDTEPYLIKYLQSRKDNDPRLFYISDRQWRKIWNNASKAAKVKITPQILRIWFATEMGERLIPDRYIDIFQGRAPRSVLAKHYTGKGVQRLKRIYNKAKLKILLQEGINEVHSR